MNKQEQFWAGPGGVIYMEKTPLRYPAARFFGRTLKCLKTLPSSAIEFGCNDGRNLRGLYEHGVKNLTGVDVNKHACSMADSAGLIYCESILNFKPTRTWELVFTKGLLVHVAPEDLARAYTVLFECSSKYILIAEYYATYLQRKPGSDDLTWKGPYAEQIWQNFPLSVLDYGFIWRFDKDLPCNNLTWFLMEKHAPSN